MISFSYRVFREHISKPLEKAEVQFLIRTFAGASAYFFLFAIAVGNINFLLNQFAPASLFFSTVCGFIGFLTYFPLHFFAIKYRNNPLRLPNSFVVTIFSLFTVCFMCLFIGISNILSYVLSSHSITSAQIWGMILFVFGISFLIYLFPVAMALFISSKRTIISLGRFMNMCYIFYACLWLISILIGFFSFGIAYVGFFRIFLFILISIILFLSPVITIYRMKTIAPFINYDDPLERKRWEQFFVFEISLQLLELAFHVMRICVFMLHKSGSRLR